MKKNTLFSLFCAVVILFSVFGGNFTDIEFRINTPLDIYSKVKIYAHSQSDFQVLQELDVDVEHYQGNFKSGIDVVLSSEEISRLNSSGLPYEILIPDIKKFYEQRQPPAEHELENSKNIMQNDNVSGFSLGSMGGFYTYAEMIQQLDSMRLFYSSIITQKINIGTSHEGRTIWAVKISDNPELNESATEPGVYYDALHHAREPMGLQAMMYYMYWLLQNYGSNPEATYLVNNREIFFVPVVNPDGYEYNRSTDPNGGGQWRKNRRNNGGSFGVDLNRNYSYGWGLNSGSSGTPSSSTYRGPSAFSEPESQAVRDFVLANTPEIGFSLHSVAGRYLNPYGYTDTSIAYEMYSDFSSEFAPENGYLYGTVAEMLDYYSSGTTRDYLHASGTYCWTPELGGSSFWPNIPEIIPLCSENLYSFKYLSWVSGAYSRMQSYKITGAGHVSRNDTLRLELIIRNKGLTKPSNNVNVTLSTSSPNVTSISPSVNFGNISPRSSASNTSSPFKFFVNGSAAVGEEIKFICSVTQEGVETSKDTVSIIVGKANVLFSDDAETGISNWTRNGTGSLTDTSFVSYWTGNKSFADSRYGNSLNSSANYFTLINNVNLSSTVNPRLEFNAKWALEDGFDYTRIQISTNNGSSWSTLTGKFTSVVSGQQSYNGIKYWVKERISLQPYVGQNVKFRFYNFTDNGVPGDGFYFDNFRIVDYRDTLTNITGNANGIPDKFRLGQNFPNPFNPSTTIKYDISKQSEVKIIIYDALGREVETIVNSELSPGRYSIGWDASALPSGIYFYRIRAGEYTEIRKMMLIK